MYSLQTLANLNDDEVKKYFRLHKPALLKNSESVKASPDYSGCDIQEAADYFGFEIQETFFVDSSGFGSSFESALTFTRLLTIITDLKRNNPEYAFYSVLSGVGQFQVYVTVFKSKRR